MKNSAQGFLRHVIASHEGMAGSDVDLPYGLSPVDFLRAVEDVHRFIFEINTRLRDSNYPPLEDLHEPAGFSGLISRFAAHRLARMSIGLTVNLEHNGYPDLIPEKKYPGNKAKAGDEGLEIKASRYESGWQGHSVRQGWYCIFQFRMDDASKAFKDRSPTEMLSVLIGKIDTTDWNVHRAGEGKDRSGTTVLRPDAVERLRANAVWVSPAYRERHEEQLAKALYKRMLPERSVEFPLSPKGMSEELGLSTARIRKFAEGGALDGLFFDFGMGKTKQRRYSNEALDRIRALAKTST